MRPSGRTPDQLREISLETGINKHAEGSCLAKFGDTHVLCMASVEQRVPSWLKESGQGWVTAEYGMLPRSTDERMDREAARGKQSGRTQEIQRLIGRSLRAATDLEKMAEIQIRIDCDVLQADGGTRTAAITGGYVALHLACQNLCALGILEEVPTIGQVAAISCGIFDGEVVLDLDYAEDSNAAADANFVIMDKGGLVEVQATAEDRAFSEEQFAAMLGYARKGINELVAAQRQALGLD